MSGSTSACMLPAAEATRATVRRAAWARRAVVLLAALVLAPSPAASEAPFPWRPQALPAAHAGGAQAGGSAAPPGGCGGRSAPAGAPVPARGAGGGGGLGPPSGYAARLAAAGFDVDPYRGPWGRAPPSPSARPRPRLAWAEAGPAPPGGAAAAAAAPPCAGAFATPGSKPRSLAIILLKWVEPPPPRRPIGNGPGAPPRARGPPGGPGRQGAWARASH
jgi:hypothetical protein